MQILGTGEGKQRIWGEAGAHCKDTPHSGRWL